MLNFFFLINYTEKIADLLNNELGNVSVSKVCQSRSQKSNK